MAKIIKRAAAVAAGLALAASSLVSTPLSAGAASSCTVGFASYGAVKAGSTGAQAEALECLLSEAGYTTTVDGSFSADDAAQLAQFRKSIGLNPLTSAGARAWSALLAQGSKPALAVGATGDDVTRLQLSLRAAGYDVTADGTFRAATATVVKAAQKSRQQAQTGAATEALWTALQAGKVKAGTSTAKPAKKPAKKSNKGAKALAFAKKQLGDPYRYGAAGPGSWDCSGLTMKAWKAAGVKLPHSSRGQFHKGKKIAKKDLRPGDLVFFYSGISHVAIYAGHGRVIHASHPGAPVAYIKMKYMPFKGARRPG